MAKPTSFRFSDEFLELLQTWAFVTEKAQAELLEEAFMEYAEKRTEIKEKVLRILETVQK
ncbi:hypothetical protein [Effusibacillus pohliae]|uniref:hypothetical protein n=1 Tax=Effusibacillus pohliae TaxID=232270 RepID=UPI00036B72EA|nr:hypothetical protein [Effusibacillus pohliae]